MMEGTVPHHKPYYQNYKEKYRQYRIENNEKLVERCVRWRAERKEERREKRSAKVYCVSTARGNTAKVDGLLTPAPPSTSTTWNVTVRLWRM